MRFAAETGAADFFNNILFEIHRNFGHENSSCANSQTDIEGQMTCISAHDFNNRAALVRLHGVTETVNGVNRSVGCGIETDGIIGANNIVIDGSGDSDYRNAVLGKCFGTAESTVAANGNNAVQTKQLTGSSCPLLSCLCAEFVTSCSVKDCTAAVNDVADIGSIHAFDITADQAAVTTANANTFNAAINTGTNNGSNGRIHTGSIAAAGKNTDSF